MLVRSRFSILPFSPPFYRLWQDRAESRRYSLPRASVPVANRPEPHWLNDDPLFFTFRTRAHDEPLATGSSSLNTWFCSPFPAYDALIASPSRAVHEAGIVIPWSACEPLSASLAMATIFLPPSLSAAVRSAYPLPGVHSCDYYVCRLRQGRMQSHVTCHQRGASGEFGHEFRCRPPYIISVRIVGRRHALVTAWLPDVE